MDKRMIITIFTEMATYLELKGENQFKVRAYQNGARIIDNLEKDLRKLVESGEITKIPGIGKTLTGNIIELITTGDLAEYHEIKKDIPSGLLEIIKIPGLGPKKAYRLHQSLGIENLAELEYACLENRLTVVKGFGEKSQKNILQGIEQLKKHRGKFHYIEAIVEAQKIVDELKIAPDIKQISIAGSLRRGKEIIKDIDIVASSDNPTSVMDYFTSLPQVDNIIAKGVTKTSITLKSGINVDLRVVKDEEYIFALHHFTGSKEHNTALRHLAKKSDIKINEYGFFTAETKVEIKTEEEFFSYLGLEYIPPELRENTGEIEKAREDNLPKLVTNTDIQGIFHVHSKYSDGNDSLYDLAEAAKNSGYKYLGISDHSQTAVYANGLKVDEIYKQHEEIQKLNEKFTDFFIFHGIESDILPDGSLDYPDEILRIFDFVIGSIHSGLNMTQEKATERILKAMDNPYFTMLGHPTGRILLGRPGYELDLEKIFQKAKEKKIIIELNANPHRLDLDWRHLKNAKSKNVLISINPDAHRKEDLDQTYLGVKVARKGWLEKKDVFNSWSLDEIKKYFASKKINGH
ncbi:DNA polymerase (family 10) [Desulfonispora thiosulfatigenes DSM 11270]|uniref:DNA-directed DNA polymerase n=1 Tax=Desulfonispora thiosulfatigenes DSM 11270 TaxID=656914 RepID=A0A1W1VHA7_DESTI|nr:DNA polymerase/3'-5' exonuclease PolX [Desulfonispora thiosulfatigenes]SMB92767.1 DNA polymerase (family 10) [Desulfonispora thiosulfatigenes DSM 11270]